MDLYLYEGKTWSKRTAKDDYSETWLRTGRVPKKVQELQAKTGVKHIEWDTKTQTATPRWFYKM